MVRIPIGGSKDRLLWVSMSHSKVCDSKVQCD